CMRRLVQRRASGSQQLDIERRQSLAQRLAAITTHGGGTRARVLELARDAIDEIVEGGIERSARPCLRQPQERPLEMHRQRGTAALAAATRLPGAVEGARRRPEPPPPFVEGLEHVSFTEIDSDRTPARTLAIVPLTAAIDPPQRHFERDAAGRPRRNELERRADHAHEMSIVLPAQVRFDFPAVVV